MPDTVALPEDIDRTLVLVRHTLALGAEMLRE
jgi:hypothetical protein